MILVIRIHGIVNMKESLEQALYRMRLRRKLSCTILDEKNKVEMGMLHNIKEFVTYGKIDSSVLKKIVIARGETLEGKKVNEKDADKIVAGIENNKWSIKKYFRLHPPVKGFRKSTKELSPRGILGENKEIVKLVERML
mgnify:FL=1